MTQISGVDSVERSPQEDTLLVLFNTALSNLVRRLFLTKAMSKIQ